MSIHSFWIVVSSILIVFVIMLENDDLFKLLLYLDIYFFSCVGILPARSAHSKFMEVFILRCLLITCPNKASKVLTLKLMADLIFFQFYYSLYFTLTFNNFNKMQSQLSLPATLTLPKMFNSIFKAFSDMLRVSKIVSLKSWLDFGFGIKTKRGFSPSTYTTTELIFEQPSSVL